MERVALRSASSQHRTQALALLAAAADDAQLADCAAAPESDGGDFPLDGLLIAEAGRELLGAALYVVQPGGVAFIWPPVVRGGVSFDGIGAMLLAEVTRRIDAAGCRLGQCLLEPGAPATPLLESQGFSRLTELLYLERTLDEPPPAPDAPLNAITWDPSNHGRFAALLESTYAGTLDCPELNGVRTAEETLAGHRASGVFDPRLWTLYEAGGRDAGLMLLTLHPEIRGCEIVYMGVAPEARGRGVGHAMLSRAILDARRAGCERILLAVDIRNIFARRLYEQHGFVELCRRAIHLRLNR